VLEIRLHSLIGLSRKKCAAINFIFRLTNAKNTRTLIAMKTVKVKTAINQLVKIHGTQRKVAELLGYSLRTINYWATGQKKAPLFVAQEIKRLAKKV